jgi:hypothetical protein
MRAGVLVCEKECQKGFLNYQLNGVFTSSSDGPMLTAKWGEGTFNEGSETHYLTSGTVSHWYRFGAGQGLQLNEGSCIPQNRWTIIITARLDDVSGSRQILGSEAWSEDGLFVSSAKYRFLPESTGLECSETIRTARYYQFGISRNDAGEVSLYVNGFKCASRKPEVKDGLILSKNDVTFFRSGGSSASNVAGFVSNIRLWATALGNDEMLKACSCSLPEESTKSCESIIVLNIPYSRHKYSSVWGGSTVGTGWATGGINGANGWISGNANTGAQNGAYVQLDVGKVKSIAGVITQGVTNGWFTRSFTVVVSEDGASWKEVACGRVFEANTDWNTKVENRFPSPIRTRYVRIIVEEFAGYPAMRVGLLTCEEECEGGILDYLFDDTLTSSTAGPSLIAQWGDGNFDSTNHWYRFGSGQGLSVDQGNCLKNNGEWSIIVDARLDSTNAPRVIGSSAWANDGLYVDGSVRFLPVSLKLKCDEKILSRRFYQFGLSRNRDGILSVSLNGFTCASSEPPSSQKGGYKLGQHDIVFFRGDQTNANTAGYVRRIRVFSTGLNEQQMASACGCSLPNTESSSCTSSVIQNAPYSKHRYSSTWGNYEKGVLFGSGKLNSQYSWLPGSAKTGFQDGEWLQIDSGTIQALAGVVTQGRGDAGWWTTSFAVRVSENGDDWMDVACGRWFQANTDMNTKVLNLFPMPVKSRFVRIYPTE